MAVPQKRTGKSAQATRRANWKATKPEVTTCPNCGAFVLAHTVCTACGFYKGKAVSIKNAAPVEEVKEVKEVKKAAQKSTKKAEAVEEVKQEAVAEEVKTEEKAEKKTVKKTTKKTTKKTVEKEEKSE